MQLFILGENVFSIRNNSYIGILLSIQVLNENKFISFNRSTQTTNFLEKNAGSLDSGFVKTCDELVTGYSRM